MAKQGQISGVGIAHRGDTEYLKSVPNGSENDNLGNLPSISPEEWKNPERAKTLSGNLFKYLFHIFCQLTNILNYVFRLLLK